MASLKFAANISFMFQDVGPLITRYAAAKKCGFKGVECAYPYGVSIEDLKVAKEDSNLDQVLINGYQGDPARKELGIGALPGREEEFARTLEISIDYAKALKCPRMHIMAGKCIPETSETEMREVFARNLKLAAARLQKENIVAVIEPINRITVPQYFLHTAEQAIEIIREINHDNLRLQCDLYHWQLFGGNLTNNIKDNFHLIDHIQIAQVPDRGPPNIEGEINYTYIFKLLEKLNFKGWIGCEYIPTPGKSTEECTFWLQELA